MTGNSRARNRLKIKDKRSRQDYLTPPDVYGELDDEFHFDFDPCPADWDGSWDGLQVEWGNSNYVNPPYRYLSKWVKKAFEEWATGKTIVLLIPASVDTNWFYDYVWRHAEIRFPGRIRFIDNKTNKPFPLPMPAPLMLVIFRASEARCVRGHITPARDDSRNCMECSFCACGCGKRLPADSRSNRK